MTAFGQHVSLLFSYSSLESTNIIAEYQYYSFSANLLKKSNNYQVKREFFYNSCFGTFSRFSDIFSLVTEWCFLKILLANLVHCEVNTNIFEGF